MAVTASTQIRTTTVIEGVTLNLTHTDAQILRTMLGGLRRKVRREAVKCNGGDKDTANRARFLVKEIIDALEAKGIYRLSLSEVTDSAPDITGTYDDSNEVEEDSYDDDVQY